MTLQKTFRHELHSERKIVRARRPPANFGKIVRTPFPVILFVLVAISVWYFALVRIATLLKRYSLHLREKGANIASGWISQSERYTLEVPNILAWKGPCKSTGTLSYKIRLPHGQFRFEHRYFKILYNTRASRSHIYKGVRAFPPLSSISCSINSFCAKCTESTGRNISKLATVK
jgi:hypothetical protein